MRILIAVLGLAISLPVMADVYQWTDETGHVQMSDHPPAGVNAKVLKGSALGSSVSAESSQEAADVSKREDSALSALKSKEAAEDKAKKDAADTSGKEADACAQLKKQQAGLSAGGSIVSYGADGERHFDTPDEIQQQQETVTQQMQDNHCN